jgi:hypothetical protein
MSTKLYKPKKMPLLRSLREYEDEAIQFEMQIYMLKNLEDTSLALVIEFSDQVIVKWGGEVQSLVVFKSLEEFMKISLTPGRQLQKRECKVSPEMFS